MGTFVETLKRLYIGERISKDKLESLLKEKKINQEEYNYILSDK